MLISEPMKSQPDFFGQDGVYQLTRMVWEGPGRIMGRNIDTMHEFVRQSGTRVGQAWSDIARMSPMTDWPAVMNTCLQCSIAINQLAIRMASQAYSEATGQSLAMFQMSADDESESRAP